MPSDEFNEFYARIFRLADSIDSRSRFSNGVTAREIIEDWISHNEPALAIKMLADAVIEDNTPITSKDLNDFIFTSKQTNSHDRVVGSYLLSLVILV